MKKIIIFIIRIYQMALSPLFPPACRFYPTCSEYMLESIKLKGILKGIFNGLRRILRCHPFHEGGFDPVERECQENI